MFDSRESELWLFALSSEQFLIVELGDDLLFAHKINIIIQLGQTLSDNLFKKVTDHLGRE